MVHIIYTDFYIILYIYLFREQFERIAINFGYDARGGVEGTM